MTDLDLVLGADYSQALVDGTSTGLAANEQLLGHQSVR
jgi:hypothetical protein